MGARKMGIESDPELIKALKATAEITGRQISQDVATMFLADLVAYHPTQVKLALQKCRHELRTFPTVADIVARIDDDRPAVEEAWAMIPHDEESSVVWTEEMREAFNVARPKLLEGDPIAARMTFKEVYPKLVATAREKGGPAHWEPSLGHDRTTHAPTLLEAVRKGRLTQAHAQSLLPGPPLQRGERLQLVGPSETTLEPLQQIQSIKRLIERGES